MIELFAKQINNYCLIPALSNDEGLVIINRNWLNDEIDKYRKLFPLDYSSNLIDCEPNIKLSIMSAEQINRAIEAYTQWKGILDFNETFVENLSNARNSMYDAISNMVDIRDESCIDIEISTRLVHSEAS